MDNRYGKVIALITSTALLVGGCTIQQPRQSHVNDAIAKALASGVADNKRVSKKLQRRKVARSVATSSLIPKVSVTLPDAKTTHEAKINVAVNDLPAREFFMSLVKNTPYNVVVDPGIDANISLTLQNVTVPQAIAAACNAYGFQSVRTAYGYRIEKRQMITRVFHVNYIDMSRVGQSDMNVSPGSLSSSGGGSSDDEESSSSESGGSGETSKVTTTTTSDFWGELRSTLSELVGDEDGRQVVVNSDAGIVIVHAYPDEMAPIAEYLDNLENIMNRQVILEAKVLEVSLDAGFQSGIQWQYLGLNLDGTAKMPGELQDMRTFFTGTTKLKNFTSVINLLNTQGRTEVLSSPHIATLNNQKAIIKVGSDEYFVTNVSSTTSGTTSSETSQDVELAPFFSGIALDVTPEITKNNLVTLHIHPVVSKVVADTKSFTLGDKETKDLPLAKSTIRESDSVVHARSGQVIVIGGLMENSTKSYDGSLPGMSQTPVSGLIGRKDKEAEKIELVILLKPTVVETNTWNDSLNSAAGNFKDMSKQFTYTIQMHKPVPRSKHMARAKKTMPKHKASGKRS